MKEMIEQIVEQLGGSAEAIRKLAQSDPKHDRFRLEAAIAQVDAACAHLKFDLDVREREAAERAAKVEEARRIVAEAEGKK